MRKRHKNFSSHKLLIPSMLVINSIIILVSFWYFKVEKKAFINQRIDQLQGIADIKIDQIVDWRNERLSDARYLSVSPQINECFRKFMTNPSDLTYHSILRNNLNGMFMNGKYESMIAYDHQGRMILSLPSETSVDAEKASSAPKSDSIFMGDFESDGFDNTLMKIVVPQVVKTASDTFHVGFIIMNINFTKTFLPLLETLPVPAKSLDVMLLFRKDEDILGINSKGIPQKTVKKLPRNLKRPGDDSIHKLSGSFLLSHNNVPVLAVSCPIPGSDSFLLVKIDRAEAYTEVFKLKYNLIALSGLMILAFTSSVSFFWMRHRNEIMVLETEKKLIMERFNMLSKFSNDAIIVYTRDLTILQVNDKALDLYGYSREEILGMNAELLRSPDTRSDIKDALETTIRTGGYRYETIHIRKDGTIIPVEESLRYVELMGSPCYQALVRDIKQRKLFEKALIDSEQRLRLITNTMPQVVWTARPDGSFDFVNSRFEFLTGTYPLKESTTADFIHKDDRDRVISYWNNAIREIREHQLRFRIRMKDGSFRWFLCLAIPMCDENGKVIRWYGSGTDINELESTVAQRTEELSDLYNNAPCGYHSLDTNGVFIKINDTALNWLGYERDEVIGKLTFGDLVTEESRKAFNNNFRIFFEKGIIDNLEYDMVRKDGTILPVLLNSTAVRDADGNIVMTRTTITDHTVRRKHEREILKLNAILQEHSYNLENANKELEAFTYSVSHDLRAPLRAINGFSQILLEESGEKLDFEGKQLIEKVIRNAGRMRQLIDDLLRLSKTSRQELHYTLIDMKALFNSMLEEIRQQFPDKTIKCTINSMPAIPGDLALLKQVITNLLSNAVKFSSKQKTTEINAGYRDGGSEHIFFIKDNGTGFDIQFASELFGVFRRLNNAGDYEGTGVGLALVKRIIDKHGGRVWADSEPAKGATFYFSLPVSKLP